MKWACLVLACLMVSSILLVDLQDTQATQSTVEDFWETMPSLPYPLSGPAVTVGEKIYIFYSKNYTTHLFVYDTQTQTINETAPMPTYRTGFGIAVVDQKIYTIGGQGASGQGPTNINEVYDTQTGTWETKQPAIDPTGNTVANAVNGKIYTMTYSHIDVYDPETDNWTRKTALPQEVLYPSYSRTIDDAIYVVKDNTGDNVYAYTIGEGKLHIYNTTTDTWSTGATLPTFYKHSRLVVTTGEHAPRQIYVVGGLIVHGVTDYEGVNASFRYDPAADCWSKAADMPTPRYEAAVAVVDDKIYVIGGATELPEDWVAKQTNAVEVYTPFGYGTVEPSASPTAPWLVFPDVTAVIVGVAIGAAIAGAVIAATVTIIKHRRHPENAKQSQPSL